MFLKLTCPHEEFEAVLASYEAYGFVLRERVRSGDQVDLVLSAPSIDLLSQGVYGDTKGYLEFEDGTVSPLYVRRDRSFDD